jgi:hypothetical protein
MAQGTFPFQRWVVTTVLRVCLWARCATCLTLQWWSDAQWSVREGKTYKGVGVSCGWPGHDHGEVETRWLPSSSRSSSWPSKVIVAGEGWIWLVDLTQQRGQQRSCRRKLMSGPHSQGSDVGRNTWWLGLGQMSSWGEKRDVFLFISLEIDLPLWIQIKHIAIQQTTLKFYLVCFYYFENISLL